jgi:hypothetical protein
VGTVTGNLAGLAEGCNIAELAESCLQIQIAKIAPTLPSLMLLHFIYQNAPSLSSSGMGFTLS